MANQEAIIKYQEELKSLKSTLESYEDLFNADGTIDPIEREQLNVMQELIKKADAKLSSLKSNVGGIPKTKEEFLARLQKYQLSFQCNLEASGTYKEIKIDAKFCPEIFIAPKPMIKGYIEIELGGVEKWLKLDEEIETKFIYNIGSGSTNFSIQSALASFEFNNNKDFCSAELELDIMQMIAGAATAYLKKASQNVVSLTTSGKMHLKVVYDKKTDSMRIASVGGQIHLGIHVVPSAHPKVGQILKQINQDPKAEANAIFDVNTKNDGKGVSVTTAKGKTNIKMTNGDKVFELSEEGEGQAKGSNQERVVLAEKALLSALQDSAANIKTIPNTIKEKVLLAKEINGVFKSRHAYHRALAEKLLQADGDMKATNTTLDAYKGLTELYDIYSDAVYVKFDTLVNPVLKKDNKTAQLINALKCEPLKEEIEFSTVRAKTNFQDIKGFSEQFFMNKDATPDDEMLNHITYYLAKIDVFKQDYPIDCEQKAIAQCLKQYSKRLKELKTQFSQ